MHDVVQSALRRVRDARAAEVEVVAHKAFVTHAANTIVAPIAVCAVNVGQDRARMIVAGEVAGDADGVELVREVVLLPDNGQGQAFLA